jgi:cobalt/nickel transport system permease protein
MHLPDGFLDARTALAAGGLAAAGAGLALRSVARTAPPSRIPLIGVAAAFVFAAQMLNFPVAGGTSGHLLGATLAAVLLGPGAAVLAMTAVLVLQCLLFADGGVTALGANLFNMALLAPLAGYGICRLTSRALGDTLRARLAGTAFGAWCSTLAAAVACAGQLALSGTAPWRTVFPAMAGVHAVIAVGEAVITTLVVAAVARARPDLLERGASDEARGGLLPLAGQGIIVAAGLVLFVAPFASPLPDGLERVAAALGFERRAAEAAAVSAPLADYALPGMPAGALSTAAAGLAGAAAAFALAYLLARVLTPPHRRDGRAEP